MLGLHVYMWEENEHKVTLYYHKMATNDSGNELSAIITCMIKVQEISKERFKTTVPCKKCGFMK